MLGQLTTLILFTSMSAEVPRQISLTAVEVGGNVTLTCPLYEDEGKFIYWYKQTPGYLAEIVATRIFSNIRLAEQFENSRFRVTERKSTYVLTIANVVKEDEATYICQNGTAYWQSFVRGIFLAVNDQSRQKSFYVEQSPATTSVHLRDSVTLQCSLLPSRKGERCPGEHSVHWFRAGNSHLGMVYARRNRSAEERICVYSLSKTILDSSDAGTYYCAVITCGQILLGQGTNVETRQEWGLAVIVLGLLLALCMIVIALLIFTKD